MPIKPDPGSEDEDDDLLQQGKLKLNIQHNSSPDTTAFVVKPTTLFRKVVEGIGKKMGVDPRAIRLVYNGDKCHLEHNPKMLEMVAGRTYELESLTEQTGGGK